jgi:hypothetical protein
MNEISQPPARQTKYGRDLCFPCCRHHPSFLMARAVLTTYLSWAEPEGDLDAHRRTDSSWCYVVRVGTSVRRFIGQDQPC